MICEYQLISPITLIRVWILHGSLKITLLVPLTDQWLPIDLNDIEFPFSTWYMIISETVWTFWLPCNLWSKSDNFMAIWNFTLVPVTIKCQVNWCQMSYNMICEHLSCNLVILLVLLLAIRAWKLYVAFEIISWFQWPNKHCQLSGELMSNFPAIHDMWTLVKLWTF